MEKTVYLIGAGLGSRNTLTVEALEKIEASGLLIGAQRILDAFSAAGGGKLALTDPGKIAEAIEASQEKKISVLFSGDLGFYSGAKRLLGRLSGCQVESLPGVSSLSYFCAKLQIPWEDAFLVSAHGRECRPLAAVLNHEKTFFLTGGGWTPAAICGELCRAGLSGLKVAVGERLSYPEERITELTAAEAALEPFDPLSVLLVLNPSPLKREAVTHGLDDGEFLRSQEPPVIPMTKSEVRSVSLSKLKLEEDSVVYDIGAGTGSVAVEAALQCRCGRVFAIERNKRAAALLNKNKEKFGVSHLQIVEGVAPEALQGLPAPDRAFIGGTGGKLEAILKRLLCANPSVHVVLNAIALESLSEAVTAFQKLGFQNVDIVQVSVAKSRKVEEYQMMIGQNPVYVIAGRGCGS